MGNLGLVSLLNEYKYRPLGEYGLVASVFNRRNVVGFDGRSVTLQSRCRYLLAHETYKNRFSVILNLDKSSQYAVSVHSAGVWVHIGYAGAAVGEESVSVELPRRVVIKDGQGEVNVRRRMKGVCVEVNKDLEVCCYEDSKSCTLAVSRWFTGKLVGLLGRGDSDFGQVEQADWFLDGDCRKNAAARTKATSEEAVKVCNGLFGTQEKAHFKNAVSVCKPLECICLRRGIRSLTFLKTQSI